MVEDYCSIVAKDYLNMKKEWDREIPSPTLFHSEFVNNSHGIQTKIAWQFLDYVTISVDFISSCPAPQGILQ